MTMSELTDPGYTIGDLKRSTMLCDAEQFCTLPSDNRFFQQLGSQVPSIADYFGIWAIHADPFVAAVERFNKMDLHVHMKSQDIRQAAADRNSRKPYTLTEDGIALISINGPTSKQVGSMEEGTSTVRIRQQLRAAANDEFARGVMVVMDTPGGTVKGNADLANEVRRLNQLKPVAVFAEDLVASAGVSVASQAWRISANQPEAMYGAIGTYAVAYDSSRMADRLGVTVHVIRAGEFKGMGEEGTQITEEQLAEWQRIVNLLNDSYLRMIADGRSMSMEKVRAVADGRIQPASEALRVGLIDAIETYDEAYSALLGNLPRSSGRLSQRSIDQQNGGIDDKSDDANEMDDKDEDERTTKRSEAVPATLKELKETFPTSTAEWREEMLEVEASLQDAAIDFANRAAEENRKLREEADEANSKAKATAGLGHSPLTVASVGESPDYPSETGDPVADFDAAVKAIAGQNPSPDARRNAIIVVSRKNPELHQAYLLATNLGRKQQRQIREKFDDMSAIAKN